MTLRDRAVAAAYVGAWRGVGRLSERRSRALFARVGGRLYRGNGRGVQQLRANLTRVRPELGPADLEDLVHDAVQSYLRYWCEAFRLESWPLDDLVARTRTIGEERLRTPYAEGRGVVAALPHQANWDWAGAWACATGMPLMTVAERLEPARVYDEFVRFRSSLGMRILPLTGAEPPMPALEEWASSGGFVCLLADRDLSRTAVDVDLCGHPARMPAGPGRLAQRTGADLVPITLAYRGEEMEITFHEPVDPGVGQDGVVAATRQVAEAFTRGLGEAPQDWHMMQRVFAADLSPTGPTGERG